MKITKRATSLLTATALSLAGALGLAYEADAREPKRPPPETKKVEAVTKATYDKLTKAHEHLNTDPPQTAQAAKILQGLLKSDKLNNHERSLAHQTYGYLYAGQENYPQAIASFRKCLQLGGLPDASALNTEYNLAQLYLVTEQFDLGIKTLKAWLDKVENPGPSAYMMMANAYAQKENYREALNWAEQGLAKMNPEKPRENWIRLVMQLNLSLERYKQALPYLEQLTRQWPKKTYFMQLAAIYGETGQNTKSLVVLELAYHQGWLEKTRELERLCQMFLYHEIPYKCGVLGEKHLGDGSMESNQKNWELLANAWTLSQEYDKALKPLERAASLADKGELFVRLGQIHIDGERWAPAEKALRRALDKGELNNPGQAKLLLGITFFNRKKFDSAANWFRQARSHPKTRRDANSWLTAIRARGDFAPVGG
ncbi:MAG: tetratricopeptide repeat protein [Proteobacteria bacterium]|nr:tetratricopeptide repeat protein [Pseudomonadota bacterium]